MGHLYSRILFKKEVTTINLSRVQEPSDVRKMLWGEIQNQMEGGFTLFLASYPLQLFHFLLLHNDRQNIFCVELLELSRNINVFLSSLAQNKLYQASGSIKISKASRESYIYANWRFCWLRNQHISQEWFSQMPAI